MGDNLTPVLKQENIHPLQGGATGLKFVSRDNNVNLKSPEINLGTDDFTIEIYATYIGSSQWQNPCVSNYMNTSIYGAGKNTLYSYTVNKNDISWTIFGANHAESVTNSFFELIKDATNNLHHVVISKSGRLIKSYINGIFTKEIITNIDLDYTQFGLQIANISFYSQCRIFNFAADESFVKYLWNNGKVDKLRLGSEWKNVNTNFKNYIDMETGKLYGCRLNITSTTIINYDSSLKYYVASNTNGVYNSSPRITFNDYTNENDIRITIAEYKTNGAANINTYGQDLLLAKREPLEDGWIRYTIITKKKNYNYAWLQCVGNTSEPILIRKVEHWQIGCILEYLPESIHTKGIYDTSGQNNHGVFSSTPPEILYTPPYVKVKTGSNAPTERPSITGQLYVIPDNQIYRATGTTSAADWKLIS